MGALQNAPQYNIPLNLNTNEAPNIMESLMTTEAEAESLPFLNLLTGSKNQENNNEDKLTDAEGEVSKYAQQAGQVVDPKDSG